VTCRPPLAPGTAGHASLLLYCHAPATHSKKQTQFDGIDGFDRRNKDDSNSVQQQQGMPLYCFSAAVLPCSCNAHGSTETYVPGKVAVHTGF
jgi:hypothetical protein